MENKEILKVMVSIPLNEYTELKKENENLKHECDLNSILLKYSNDALAEKNTEIKNLKMDLNAYKNSIEILFKSINQDQPVEDKCAQCEWMEDQMDDMEKKLEAAEEKITNLEKENEELIYRLHAHRRMINTVYGARPTYETVQYNRDDEKYNDELEKAKAKIAKLEKKIARKDRYIADLRDDLKSANKALMLSDDDRMYVRKALEFAVETINRFDTYRSILLKNPWTIEHYINLAKKELEVDKENQ